MERSIGELDTMGPGETPRQELEQGARLGRYIIIRLLGRGGMGQVYLARHEMQRTLHALKLLPAEAAARKGFVERFQTELRTMARLQHPNIVHVTHSDEEHGRYYLVMDFIAADGTEEPYDLEEALAEHGRMEAATARRLALQVCEGLAFAHREQVVHRDLKPANILLNSRNLDQAEARVGDFGLARVLGEEQVRTMVARSMQLSMSIGNLDTFVEKRRVERSSTGAVLGTYGYMSPEQEEGRPADGRSDIYALGVLLYRMITGQRLRGRAKAASTLVKGLDPAWDSLIDKCLEPDPCDRWQSMEELKAALEGLEGRRRRGSGATGHGKPVRVLAAVVLLAVLGVGVYAGWTRGVRPLLAAQRERQEAEMRQAELDAETQVRARALRAAVESALASGDLREAGRLLSELEAVEGTGGAVTGLRQRYEALAGERETNQRYADASMARDAALLVERGQTLGDRIDELERRWREAEAARQGRAWGQALSAYDAVLSLGQQLAQQDRARQAAVAERDEGLAARREAAGDSAANDAQAVWQQAEASMQAAGDAFEDGDFPGAAEQWGTAAEQYRRAGQQAVAVQAYTKARTDYETALEAHETLLTQHGGDRWREVLRQARIGEASTNDPAAGRQAYAGASAGLNAAVTEARAHQRASQIETALAAARTARDNQRWEDVVRHAERALTLDATHREALVLKSGAEEQLGTFWRIVTTVGGREVAGTVAIGEQSWNTPHRVRLQEGGRYTARFSYESGGKRYTAPESSVTADWKGERELRVALVEIQGPVAGENWTSPTTGMEFVEVKEGSFEMGSASGGLDRERPVRTVRITRDFWMGKYEVTNSEYQRFVRESGYNGRSDADSDYLKHFSGGSDMPTGDRHPVVWVSWTNAVRFCRWLTEKEQAAGRLPQGYVYRLPTEAEWEYAARGGHRAQATTYAGSNDINAVAWYDGNSANKTQPVGTKAANELGLHDMSGNVREWVHDWYQNSYSGLSTADPTGPANGTNRVYRGGSWYRAAPDCRVAYRACSTPSNTLINLGFRVVLAAPVQ